MTNLRLRPHFLATSLLLIAVILSFDGLLLNLGSQIGGAPDLAARSLWHLWWPQFSLRQPDFLSIHSFSGAPYLSNHVTYLPVLPSMLFAPLQLAGNPVFAFNLILLLSFIATCYALYHFLVAKNAAPTLAALATTAFVLSPWYQNRLAEADVIGVGLWPLPLALLAWDRWIKRPTAGRAVSVVLVVYAAILSGVQHLSWILVLWIPYAIWTGRTLWQNTNADGNELTTVFRDQAAAMGLVLGILILIYPAPNLVRTLQGNEPAFSSLEGAIRTTSLLGAIVRAGPVIWLFTAAALVFAKRERHLTFWLLTGGLSLVFAVGLLPEPLRMLAGALGLPYLPLYETPIFFAPALVTFLTFSCLAGKNLWKAWSLDHPARTLGLGAAIFALTLAGNPRLLGAYPSQELPVPTFYETIASEAEDYVVLSYPFGLANTADERSLGEGAFLSQYAVWHHKRTVSGVGPYHAPAVFDDLEEKRFLLPETLSEDERSAAASELAVAVTGWRIGYVVAHQELLSPEALATIDALAKQSGALCPAVEREGLIIYRALWHPFGCTLE